MQSDTRMSLSMTISFLDIFPSVQSCQARNPDHTADLCHTSSAPGHKQWLGCFDVRAVTTAITLRFCPCSASFSDQSPLLLFLSGVLQVEAMAQLGGLLMIDPENEAAKNNFFFGGVDNCKWRRPVVPGDCLVSFPSSFMLTAYPV